LAASISATIAVGALPGEGADRAGVERLDLVRGGQRGVRGDLSLADGDRVGDEPDAVGLLEEAAGDLAEGDPGGGLTRGGPLEDRAGVVEPVLLHADEVGVAGTRAGQRLVACDLLLGVDVVGGGVGLLAHRVGAHDGLPPGPLGVADHDRDRGADRRAVADTAEEGHLVLLELHPRTAAVAEASTGQGTGDV
jgi:hypothetical protein